MIFIKVWYIILIKQKNKMKNRKYILIFLFFILSTFSHAKENFFHEAKKMYDKEKYKDSKFLFQRNIVFNPKDAKSYFYLSKIYKIEKKEKEEEKNLNTTLLLEPNNEEAVYMLIDIELKRSNFSKVKDLLENFKLICKLLCKDTALIKERLENSQAKDES